MQIYLDKSHENYIINVLINTGAEKNFLFQKLIKKKQIYIKITKVSAHTIDDHIFTIYMQATCKTHATNSEEIRHVSIHTYLTINIADYDATLR